MIRQSIYRAARMVAALAVAVGLMAGCGSNLKGSDTASPPATRAGGSVAFTIHWPDSPGAASRLIPAGTNRIVVKVAAADISYPVCAIVNRNPQETAGTIVLNGIPSGLNRWISAEARHVDDALLTPEVIQNPTAAQLVQGDILASGGMENAVPIFGGVRLNADLTLQPPGQPDAGTTEVTVVVQQVLPDAFPMVLLMDLIRDQDGRPLTNINAGNLTLYEDDVQAPIVDVRTVGSAATTAKIVLALDCSGSMDYGTKFADMKASANTFIDLLQPGDSVEIISFNSSVNVVQSFTTDTALLHQAINNLATSGYTHLWEAGVLGAEHAGNAGGRTAVVLMTDGINEQGGGTAQDVVDAARVHTTPVFTVALGLEDQYRHDLEFVASETNGLFYSTPSSDGLEAIYRTISTQLAGQLQVSFISPNPTASAARRQLRLEYRYGQYVGTVTTSYLYDGNGVRPPLDIASSGTISDTDTADSQGYHYDDVGFTPTRAGTITVTMTRASSGGVNDPYLEILQNGSRVAYNDDGGGDRNARVTFAATPGLMYVARFRTFNPSDRGGYTYTIVEGDDPVSRLDASVGPPKPHRP